jgi:N-acetylglucosamine repressor
MNCSGQGPIGNIDLVKQINGSVVYRLIDQQGPISRIQIAETSQLAPASVTKITRQLLLRGLIREVEQQASTGGRRAISIVTDNHGFQAVAIRLGRCNATLALYDLGGKLLAEETAAVPETDQNALEAELIRIIDNFIKTQQTKIIELVAISVVMPGLVDPENGIVTYMPHMKVDNWQLLDAIKNHFDITTFIGHDIRSLALAEHYFGETKNCDDSLLIRIHRGVGAGIIINGQVFLGKKRNVGEIGHIQVDPLGKRCHCGNFGCLENIISNHAIEKHAQTLINQGYPTKLTVDSCTISNICDAVNNGDRLAIEIIENAGRYLGKAVAISINLLNPQKIVITGEITAAHSVLLPSIQHCIDTQALKNFRENIPLVISKLDHQSAIGAFALVKRSMLNGVLLQQLLGEHLY